MLCGLAGEMETVWRAETRAAAVEDVARRPMVSVDAGGKSALVRRSTGFQEAPVIIDSPAFNSLPREA